MYEARSGSPIQESKQWFKMAELVDEVIDDTVVNTDSATPLERFKNRSKFILYSYSYSYISTRPYILWTEGVTTEVAVSVW